MYSDEDADLDSELTGAESDGLQISLEKAITSGKKSINMDARRKIEQLKEEKALKQQLADDFWEEKSSRNT